VRAAALGAATGSRSTAGITALALTSRPDDRGVIASRAGSRPGQVVAPLAAAGEITADKLPSTPSRLGARGLIPRIALAATAAAGMATRDSERPASATVVAAAALAAVTAFGSAALGVRFRALAARRLGSDLPGAFAEDALAGTLAWLGARRPLPVNRTQATLGPTASRSRCAGSARTR
jgi:uncharacterized membrane protein